MPVYAYKCRDCGSPLEVQQQFSDAALTVCPSCGGTLRKQYGSIGVTFNGSGFYRTDSRSGGEAKSTDGAAKTDAPKSDGAAAKTESAPAKPKADSGAKASTPAS